MTTSPPPRAAARCEVRFRAQDSYSPLQKAEYSLDAGDHTVGVRVHDQFDNPVLAETTFLVQ